MLGHISIQNTLIYTQLIDFKNDEYTAKVAIPNKESASLTEPGLRTPITKKTESSVNESDFKEKSVKVQGCAICGRGGI